MAAKDENAPIKRISSEDRLREVNMVKAFSALQRGQNEQSLIERTLGQGLLGKLAGKSVSLIDLYGRLGGTDPVVLEMLGGGLSETFKTIPVLPGVETAHQLANSAAVGRAAAGKSVELNRNMLTQVDGQALNTLAELGGAEFRSKHGVER